MKKITKHALFLISGFVLGIGLTFLFDVKKILANEELQNITNHLFASDSNEYSFNRNNTITDEDDRKERITVEGINNSQTLLIEPSISISESKRHLGNGKFSDSISVCTTYLYETKVIRKYKTYVTVDLNNFIGTPDDETDWNYTEITEEEEAMLKEQGVMFCDTVIKDMMIAGWYKVSYQTVEEKRTQANQNINSGIGKNKNRGKYKPIRTKEDLLKVLEDLTKSK